MHEMLKRWFPGNSPIIIPIEFYSRIKLDTGTVTISLDNYIRALVRQIIEEEMKDERTI